MRSERVDRIGHGVIAGSTSRTGRTITMGVHVERDTEEALSAWARAMSGLFPEGGTGHLTAEEDGLTLSTSVVLDGDVKVVINRDYLWGTLEIPLFAPSPFLFGETQRVTVAAAGSGIGLRYPLFSPNDVLDYGAPSRATTGVLTNTGTADAWPVFWPVGDMPSGFRIIQDGHVIEWAGPVALGVPVAVDSERSAVEIAGTDASQLLARDDFQPVRRRASSHITFEPLGGATGYLEATLAPTYI